MQFSAKVNFTNQLKNQSINKGKCDTSVIFCIKYICRRKITIIEFGSPSRSSEF